ncbi:MAG: YcjX family protein [Acetobacteraceae bacterium]|nr:YcjX family protein [Acetobacteraceae bacterium]
MHAGSRPRPPVAEARLLSVREAGLSVTDAPLFPLEAALGALGGRGALARTHPPARQARARRWRCSRPSRGHVGRLVGPLRRAIRLELVDYPGEWLLDLPLLPLSFE